MPEALEFVTRPMLALQLLENLAAVESLPELVIADAGYGANTEFREQLTALGFTYVVGVTGVVSLLMQAQAPLQAKELAMQLPPRRFRTVTWREGTNAALSSRFAAIRVHCASRAARTGEACEEQWLLVEWPKQELEPTKYFFSTLPADTPIKELVRLAKLRWRIERDYQELKQELGLGHFEGRSWRGFHHHATLCMVAYGFLVTERLVVQKKNSSSSVTRRSVFLTRRLPAPGRPCVSNAMCRIRSPRCDWSLLQRCLLDLSGARAAAGKLSFC